MTTTTPISRLAVAAALVGVSLTGCAGAIEGQPVGNGTWNTCTLPDTAIQAAGLDPTTESEMQVFHDELPQSWACSWDGNGYRATVAAEPYTVTRLATSAASVQVHPVTIDGRPDAISYIYDISVGYVCSVAFSAGELATRVQIGTFPSDSVTGEHLGPDAIDECTIALRTATALNTAIPR